MEYSKNVVVEVQKYWKERFKEELTEDTTNQYLDSFADLYACFTESIKQGFKGRKI